MRNIITSEVQTIINKVNQKSDFSYSVANKSFKLQYQKGYIVEIHSIIKSYNPSIIPSLNILVSNKLNSINSIQLDDMDIFFIGGWLDKNTGIYELGISQYYKDLSKAKEEAIKLNQTYIFDIENNACFKV